MKIKELTYSNEITLEDRLNDYLVEYKNINKIKKEPKK